MSVADVLENRSRWHVACADAVAFMNSLPDDSIDLLFTSPPYLEARTYGIGAGRKLEPWVDWMAEVVTVASKKVRGLIAVNCEGQTRNYKYLPAPFLLMARLHEAGLNLRKPVVFKRIGIPGSGGPDWLRNDWEPVVCVTREGSLPWSDNTACGRSMENYRPGGPMSNRRQNGQRVSCMDTHTTADGSPRMTQFTIPDKANPGNVIDCGNVGGGNMGHPLCHENEAPFPLKLAEFFVKSFCPPDGITCDPFAGSGTTAHAAYLHGRRFVGADIRESQVALCERRLATVTPDLFAGV